MLDAAAQTLDRAGQTARGGVVRQRDRLFERGVEIGLDEKFRDAVSEEIRPDKFGEGRRRFLERAGIARLSREAAIGIVRQSFTWSGMSSKR